MPAWVIWTGPNTEQPEDGGYFAWLSGLSDGWRGYGTTEEEAIACLMAVLEEDAGNPSLPYHEGFTLPARVWVDPTVRLPREWERVLVVVVDPNCGPLPTIGYWFDVGDIDDDNAVPAWSFENDRQTGEVIAWQRLPSIKEYVRVQ